MKKKLLFSLALTALLSGCFGPAKFDAANETTVKESVRKIADSLPEDQREEFSEAITYFTLGGSDGFKSMMSAIFSGKPETMLAVNLQSIINLQSINGLTGEQILTKYRASLEQDRLKKEREAVEKEAQQEKEAIEKKAQQEREAIEKEAQDLLKDNKFEEALAKYKAMGEISSGVEAAEAGMARTTKAMKDFTEKMDYIGKVQITEFVARRIDTYSKTGIPAVRISLKNTGNLSLDKVKVIVYFQDKNGNTIFEEGFHPVSVSKYSFSGDNKPLKSGYVKEMEKDKYYTIESELSEWAEGEAVAKVTDIEFTE